MKQFPRALSGSRLMMNKIEPIVYKEPKRTESGNSLRYPFKVSIWQRSAEIFFAVIALASLAFHSYTTVKQLLNVKQMKPIIFAMALYFHSITVAMICVISVYVHRVRDNCQRRAFRQPRQLLKPNVLIVLVIGILILIFSSSLIGTSLGSEFATSLVQSGNVTRNQTRDDDAVEKTGMSLVSISFISSAYILAVFMNEYNDHIAELERLKKSVEAMNGVPDTKSLMAVKDKVKGQMYNCGKNFLSFVSNYSTLTFLWSLDLYGMVTFPIIWLCISKQSRDLAITMALQVVFFFTMMVIFCETSHKAGQIHEDIDDSMSEMVIKNEDEELSDELFIMKENFKTCPVKLDAAGIVTINRKYWFTAISSTLNLAVILYQISPPEDGPA